MSGLRSCDAIKYRDGCSLWASSPCGSSLASWEMISPAKKYKCFQHLKSHSLNEESSSGGILEDSRAGRSKFVKWDAGVHVLNSGLTTITLPSFKKTLPLAQPNLTAALLSGPPKYGISDHSGHGTRSCGESRINPSHEFTALGSACSH